MSTLPTSSISSALALHIVQAWPESLLVTDAEGRIQAWSTRAAEELGLSDGMQGKSAHTQLCSQTRDGLHQLSQCPFHDNTQDSGLALWHASNEQLLPIEYRLIPLIDGWRCFECHNTHDAVYSRSEMHKLSLLSEHNPSPLLELDANGLMQFSNPAMTDLLVQFGFDEHGAARVLPETLQHCIAQCLATQETLQDIEVRVDEHWFSWRFAPGPEGVEGQTVLATGMDISSQKQLETQRAQWQQTLEAEKESMRREYLAKTRHDLRSPLNAVVGFADLLAETLDDRLDKKELRMLEHIARIGRSLAEQISSSLADASLESASFSLNKQMIAPAAVMQTVADTLQPLFTQKNLVLDVQLPAEDMQLMADPVRLVQILTNLLANAAKYTETGSVIFSTNCIKDDNLGQALAISVRDTGPGIALDEQTNVFKAFHRCSSHVASAIEGTGLGLAIAQELAQLHGGRITLASTPGNGSTFTLILPL